MTKTAFVFLANGFEEIEAVAPIDILRRAQWKVVVISLQGDHATGSHDIIFQADQSLDTVEDQVPDLLIFPGGMPGSQHLGENTKLKDLARRVLENGHYLAAICAAPAYTLGAWGLLSGKTATCYPGCETVFPADVTYCPDSVVVDGKIITASGPGVACDFALKIVEICDSKEKAAELKKQMQFPIVD